MELDKWQEEVMKTKGSMVLRSGRQVGKSTVIGLKAAKYSLDNTKKLIMVISKTEKQAALLFSKILMNIHNINKNQIKKGKYRPTKTRIQLKNGSDIYCLCAGDTGYGLMGYTIDLLIADEAAFIPEEVWNSVIPALAITRGSIWLLSTPFIKEGYYYDCFQDSSFTSFHTSSEDCPRKDDIFLEHKKRTLTKAQYAQMYLGEFMDEFTRFFPDELIKKVCTLKQPENINNVYDYYIGCDVARMDKDKFTFEIIKKISKRELIHVYNDTTNDVPIPESTRKIISLNLQYNFKKEYIDSGGMGITVCDILREDNENKRKVVEINNASRAVDRDGKHIKLRKEELYTNLKKLMEQGEIKLLDDEDVKASLGTIQGEHHKVSGRLILSGRDTHITEGLIRAAWCSQTKDLKLWVSYI